MQTQIGPSVLIALAIPLVLGAVAAIIAQVTPHTKKEDEESADIWRAHKLRGGVSARSPWHSSADVVNIPALVEVQPVSRRPIHTPVRDDADSATVSSVSATDSAADRSASAAIEETNRNVVLELRSQGLSKTKIIKHIWGVSPGGSAKYKEARAIYESIMSEGETNA